jgi:hypothetical protein
MNNLQNLLERRMLREVQLICLLTHASGISIYSRFHLTRINREVLCPLDDDC